MLCAIGASFVFQVLTRPMVGYNWVVSGMVVGVLDSVMDSVLDPRFNPSDVFATNGPAAGELFCAVSKFMYVTAFIRVSCSVSLFRVLRLTVAKRPVLFADFNQTNEHVFPAQAETLVHAVCDCFGKGTVLIHGSPSIERDLDKNAIFGSLNAQEAGIKDEIWGWMLRDDLEAIVLRGLQDFNQCVIDHFSDGPAVVGGLTLCKIDSSEWHDRSPLHCSIDLLGAANCVRATPLDFILPPLRPDSRKPPKADLQ